MSNDYLADLNKRIAEIVRDQQLEIAKYTEAQVVELISQAVRSGDFARYSLAGDPASGAVIYLPFAERDALKAEVAAYKSQICSHTDQINQQIEVGARLRDENARLRETLKFIAIGCFVPPDGGEPRFEDAIDAALKAAGEGEA